MEILATSDHFVKAKHHFANNLGSSGTLTIPCPQEIYKWLSYCGFNGKGASTIGTADITRLPRAYIPLRLAKVCNGNQQQQQRQLLLRLLSS
eukprot:1432365-Amphidinium_carterae.1